MNLTEILKDTHYNLSLFSDEEIKALETKIKIQKNKPYVECIIREKDVQLKTGRSCPSTLYSKTYQRLWLSQAAHTF